MSNIYQLNNTLIQSFKLTENNERETLPILQNQRSLDISGPLVEIPKNSQRIHYISDIHVMHKIKNAGCRSEDDVLLVIQKLVNDIEHKCSETLLIGGDIASDFVIFQLFVNELYKALKSKYSDELHKTIIFVLGNHDLWSFPGFTIDEIVNEYRTLLSKYGMYLLHNEILCINGNHPRQVSRITYDELLAINETELKKRLSTRTVIFGGIGFSGYNKEFNANKGIYRDIINREIEIYESKKFEKLYDKLYPILKIKNSIVMTHMPKDCWHHNSEFDTGVIYVSGHTHRNYMYDDGEIRVYADNQPRYESKHIDLKSFLMSGCYNPFSEYDDGIFEITYDQYQDFYRSQDGNGYFNWSVYKLYMLKKNGYYCFIHESKTKSMIILNGGSRKKIPTRNIEYYYEHMDNVIESIREPYDKYFKYQTSIANVIKKIGGRGTIHGCIIDIDFFNHIYVNPFDSSITGYWAADMVNKIAYPSIPLLLEDRCPELYINYKHMLEDGNINLPVLVKQTAITGEPQEYLSTDIYKASRQMNKLQKTNSNILTFWPDNDEQTLLLSTAVKTKKESERITKLKAQTFKTVDDVIAFAISELGIKRVVATNLAYKAIQSNVSPEYRVELIIKIFCKLLNENKI